MREINSPLKLKGNIDANKTVEMACINNIHDINQVYNAILTDIYQIKQNHRPKLKENQKVRRLPRLPDNYLHNIKNPKQNALQKVDHWLKNHEPKHQRGS